MKRLGTLALTTMSLLLLEVVLLSCGLRRSFSEADRSSGVELPSGADRSSCCSLRPLTPGLSRTSRSARER